MNDNETIVVAKDFSDDPFGRDSKQGPNSGERFRDDFLIPALERSRKVVVDGGSLVFGYSFLEEAFGGLVRKGFTKDDVLSRVEFRHKLGSYAHDFEAIVDRAARLISR